jgi:hypothetical protein
MSYDSTECEMVDESLLGIDLETGVSDISKNITKGNGEPLFTHKPLDLSLASIRLVDILGRGLDGLIQCTIKHVTIDHLPFSSSAATDTAIPDYTCLSYVWGPPESLHWITINGTHFQVRQNLWDFLNGMAYVKCNLWIDALCIDQNDTTERNHQVQQMGWIYSNAARVIVWMGNDANIASLFGFNMDTIRHHRQKGYRAKMLVPLQSVYVNALCNNVYWRRAWITQEMLLARELHLIAQEQTITLEKLKKVAKRQPRWIYGSHNTEPSIHRRRNAGAQLRKLGRPEDDFNKLRILLDSVITKSQSSTLIENLERFRNKQCSNPQDHVYSLLSISRDGEKIQVDYCCPLGELAQNVLGLTETDICLRRAIVVLQSLQLHKNLSALDARTPFIQAEGTVLSHHDEPCQQCGEGGKLSSLLSTSIVSDIRRICLHCDHSMASVPIMTHRRCHYGHLVFFWCALGVDQEHGWALYWLSVGSGEWQELKGYTRALFDQHGNFKSLVLSVGAVCELMHFMFPQGNLDDPRFLGITHTSKWSTKWTAGE